MKQHLKRWKWLYIFYLTVINYFVKNDLASFTLVLGMLLALVMFYRATIERIYNNNRYGELKCYQNMEKQFVKFV